MRTHLLRGVALAIALAGVVDPAIFRARPVKPEVSLVSDDRLPDPSLVDRVSDALRSRFTIIRGPSLGAAAVVSIGYEMPAETARTAGRAFAVFPEPRRPFAAISAVSAPTRMSLQARTPVDVQVRTAAARDRTLTVTMRRDGVSIDQTKHRVNGDETVERLQLQFVPSSVGRTTFTVEADIDGASRTAVDLTATVEAARWAVLVFDRRPSWMSTFVRRTLESDPRFVVTSRVATSRSGPGVTAGQPPAALSALPSLELFDLVVVGAPEDLTNQDLVGLQGFLRNRGRTVILLLDQPGTTGHSSAFRSLTGVSRWTLTERADPWGEPLASAVLRPMRLPDWAERVHSTNDPGEPPSIWRTAVGRGSLVVSGALDAWRFRDANAGAFGVYWRRIVAEGAGRASLPAVDDALAPRVSPDERELIQSWTHARGGRAFGESALEEMAPALDQALKPARERRPHRPMHSPWWMAPFALALGAEWWLRRRSGLR